MNKEITEDFIRDFQFKRVFCESHHPIRDVNFAYLRTKGFTYKRIAKKYQLSPERVRLICIKYEESLWRQVFNSFYDEKSTKIAGVLVKNYRYFLLKRLRGTNGTVDTV